MSKVLKIIISITLFILCIGGVLYYSEYRTKNFVKTFIFQNPDDFERYVDNISIWEMDDGVKNTKLVSASQNEKTYKELHKALSNWEVKRTLIKDLDTKNSYQIEISRFSMSVNTVNVLISEDGVMGVRGKKYQLRKGNIEELLELIK